MYVRLDNIIKSSEISLIIGAQLLIGICEQFSEPDYYYVLYLFTVFSSHMYLHKKYQKWKMLHI